MSDWRNAVAISLAESRIEPSSILKAGQLVDHGHDAKLFVQRREVFLLGLPLSHVSSDGVDGTGGLGRSVPGQPFVVPPLAPVPVLEVDRRLDPREPGNLVERRGVASGCTNSRKSLAINSARV
jgi:hypothetical protein